MPAGALFLNLTSFDVFKKKIHQWEMNRVQTEGHQWGIEQGADRGAPVGQRTGCS